MPKYKVTHALFTYRDANGRRRDAFRGEVIDVPQAIYDASDGALIGEHDELGTPGQLVELIDEPGDEHIDQYLRSGTADEIIGQLPKYTREVTDRLLVAERAGQARPKLLAALGDTYALNPDLKKVEQSQANAPTARTARTSAPASPPAVTSLADDSTDEDVTAYLKAGTADDVVKASADWSPELRARVIEAEKAGKGRTTIVDGLTKLDQQ